MNKHFKAMALGAALLTGLTACASGGNGANNAVADDCKPKHEFSTIKEGVLTVALTNTPPYSFEENGKLAGIDSEILTDFAAQECLTVEYAPYTYATAVPAVEQGRVDVAIGGFYRTAARGEVVRLSEPVYLDELSVISKDGVSTVDGLLGKKLGTVEGYLWVDALKSLPGTETRTYPDSLNLAQDVKAGRIDIGLDGYGAAARSAEGTDFKVEVLEKDDRVPATVEPSQTSLLMNPGNDQFGDALDETIVEMRETGRLVEILENNGLPASAAEVGDARLI
ncbi:substrate-binding periplasmic protein [Arthrobacter mobilis]|uniref:Amino acid ABC transporter substrate-binding protein n=1 Tax=Arthrobacter mobilis TaxID=2724944 RepID=A0A7X6HFT9_9MICC|nr:ABC transporter substrate-binding protein [Arthrobacter mobilis]NKX55424.1 amino acid ABC transporter substrate-binding protein [Arthrobacter mobilis]